MHNRFFLPALGVGLVGFSLYIGLIVAYFQNVSIGSDVRHNFLFHYAWVVIVLLVLYILSRRQLRFFGGLSVFIAVAAIFCLIIPFLPLDSYYAKWGTAMPLMAVVLCRAMFASIGFFLLYRAAPLGREAFFIALMLAACDLLWTLLSPLLGLISLQAAHPHVVYLYHIVCWLIGGAGLCFAASLFASRQELPQSKPALPNTAKKWQLFIFILMASASVFLLIGILLDTPVVVGLLLDMSNPKFSIDLRLSGAVYLALLFCLPLAAKLLDQRPDRMLVACIGAVLAVFLLKLANGLIDKTSLHYLLDIVRLFFWVAAHAVAAKLFRGQAIMLLLLVLVYSLLPLQFVGVAIRNHMLAAPFELTLISLLLVAGVIICLWQCRRIILAAPALWSAPPAVDEKLISFAAAHDITARERDVLQCLLHNDSREDIAQSLRLSARTVRFHLSNLQRKLSVANERSVIDYYNSWPAKS